MSTIHYTVTQTIRGLLKSDNDPVEPVEVKWYRGTDVGKALAALVDAALPQADAYFEVLSATITHDVIEPVTTIVDADLLVSEDDVRHAEAVLDRLRKPV